MSAVNARAVRDELKQRKEAHEGDVIAALDDVLSGVFRDVDIAAAQSQRSLSEADAAIRRAEELASARRGARSG
jgi:hypothetical protein